MDKISVGISIFTSFQHLDISNDFISLFYFQWFVHYDLVMTIETARSNYNFE